MKETCTFKLEVEIRPEAMRNFKNFSEVYAAVMEEIYINADLYTQRYQFDEDTSDEEEKLSTYDLRNLKNSNRAEYFIKDPFK